MKSVMMIVFGLACFVFGTVVMAQAQDNVVGIGTVAGQVTSNLGNIARLITAAAYVAGMAFVIGSIVKFKAHKDNPTQIPIGTPIALLFLGAALIFVPTVFKSAGQTLFGTSGTVAGISGIVSFGVGGKQGG
jgi:intracellular multiplication protein IcmD